MNPLDVLTIETIPKKIDNREKRSIKTVNIKRRKAGSVLLI